MAGTKQGGKAAARTNLEKDPNFYSKIGTKGGSKGAKDGAIKGFAAMSLEKRRAAGAKGGRLGKRGPASNYIK